MKIFLQGTVLLALILTAGSALAHAAPYTHAHLSGEGDAALLLGLALAAGIWLVLGWLGSLRRSKRDARE
jgi:hypothetical protein